MPKDDLESRFTKLEHEVDLLREGFAMQATDMAQITALLTTIAGPKHGESG